jgi:hypothetical protein
MFLLSLLGGWRSVIVAALAASAALYGAHLYDVAIDDPAVVASARAGFVTEAERDALAGRLAETERQRLAAEAAAGMLRNELDRQTDAEQAAADKLEQARAEYEQKLADEGRKCTLNDEDVQWLQSTSARRRCVVCAAG